MRKILVTGGTTFVSRYTAEYFVEKGYEVYVLNRNTKPQSPGVHLIEADRRHLGDCLKGIHFEAVIDVTAYTATDVHLLMDALGSYEEYCLISSSAVYPEHQPQPFTEETSIGPNIHWGKYGTDKIEAEEAVLARTAHGYIIRPPYLYGAMDNLYREAFVFECALKDRPFYLPKEGRMMLQFFHVKDMCRLIEILFEQKPEQQVFNVGNERAITIKEWVKLCYRAAGKEPEFVQVPDEYDQREYFSFYDYEYYLSVDKQRKLMSETMDMTEGLAEALDWYRKNPDLVDRKPYMDFIDFNIAK